MRIPDREEDGWEVVECYLYDDRASDSEDEKKLNKARREAVSNKKKWQANKVKDRKKQFRNAPSPFSVNWTKDKVPTKIISEHQKYVISAEKKEISSMTVPFEERDDFDFTYKRDWEVTEQTKNVSVQERLKQNIEFWKNELKVHSYRFENLPMCSNSYKNNILKVFHS